MPHSHQGERADFDPEIKRTRTKQRELAKKMEGQGEVENPPRLLHDFVTLTVQGSTSI